MKPTFKIEDEVKDIGYKYVAGVDECGRGPGAGPVVAAAVRIPTFAVEALEGFVNDSKKLSEKKRKVLCRDIMSLCDWGIGSIGNEIIDEINILEATKLAMRVAIGDLKKVDYLIIDGNFSIKELWLPHHPVIKGDALSLSIAAASIIAKVHRDEFMVRLHEVFPLYGWDKNKGYLTKEHIEAIKEYGVTEYHRLSFNKVGK
jgi:ribonuclease HII